MMLRFQQKLTVPTSTQPLIERPHVLALLDRAILGEFAAEVDGMERRL